MTRIAYAILAGAALLLLTACASEPYDRTASLDNRTHRNSFIDLHPEYYPSNRYGYYDPNDLVGRFHQY